MTIVETVQIKTLRNVNKILNGQPHSVNLHTQGLNDLCTTFNQLNNSTIHQC